MSLSLSQSLHAKTVRGKAETNEGEGSCRLQTTLVEDTTSVMLHCMIWVCLSDWRGVYCAFPAKERRLLDLNVLPPLVVLHCSRNTEWYKHLLSSYAAFIEHALVMMSGAEAPTRQTVPLLGTTVVTLSITYRISCPQIIISGAMDYY